MDIKGLAVVNGVYIVGDNQQTSFENIYIATRSKENRVYPDEIVAKLPHIAPEHPHYKEWHLRKGSVEKLLAYLKNKKRVLHILEVGCGNGWVAAQLAQLPDSTVTAIDVNMTELQQAARVFKDINNLKFIYADIRTDLRACEYDIIIFAASVQYFSSLTEVLDKALQHTAKDGEVHIIDSVFYEFAHIPDAKKRSVEHYSSLGIPEMYHFYFHHNIEQLNRFTHKVLFDPGSFMNKFTKKNPFHWICVKGTNAVINSF